MCGDSGKSETSIIPSVEVFDSKYSTTKMSKQYEASSTVCSISMNLTDRIRLIEVPHELKDGIRQTILESWSQGIQREQDYYGVHEFKLKGNPWRGMQDDAVWSRALIGALLAFMAKNGWFLLQSTDISKKKLDKDTLFFEYVQPDPEAQVFAISFNMQDRIRVIGAPQIMPAVKNVVQTYWKNGIQNERDYYGAPELKLYGYPWFSDGEETVIVRTLLNHILSDLRGLGFKLYGSIDLSTGQTEGQDLETWYFRKVNPIWY